MEDFLAAGFLDADGTFQNKTLEAHSVRENPNGSRRVEIRVRGLV